MAAWISDREAVASSDELGKDLEHVEMLQRNFADFLKVCLDLVVAAVFTIHISLSLSVSLSLGPSCQ